MYVPVPFRVSRPMACPPPPPCVVVLVLGLLVCLWYGQRVKAQLHQAQLNVKHLSDQLLETDRDRARIVADNKVCELWRCVASLHCLCMCHCPACLAR
jgi:hypothetical protein